MINGSIVLHFKSTLLNLDYSKPWSSKEIAKKRWLYEVIPACFTQTPNSLFSLTKADYAPEISARP